MSDNIIRVEGVGKRYKIGSTEPYKTLGSTFQRAATLPLRILKSMKAGRFSGGSSTEFWALQGVSFEVNRGDVVGLIGRNGSGKSTLLKVLSRITEPTAGRIELRGRVGSLLEVGTGFHPELTGRENIFLNGAILGMKRVEIQRKFDEIVAFAEVGKFVDTPVKHYSSGMYLRLAFSVAAHLESEILVVDEVLAVGDASFQKKCLGRMSEVSKGGRTVLFVSHNMAAVKQLTTKGIVLQQGQLQYAGDTETAIEYYLANANDLSPDVYEVGVHGRRWPGLPHTVEFVRLELAEQSSKILEADEDLVILTTLRAHENVEGFRLSITVFSVDGTPIGTTFGNGSLAMEKGDTSTFEFRLPNPRLAPGSYHVGMGVGLGNPLGVVTEFDVILDVVHFDVMPPEGEGGTASNWARGWGAIRMVEPVVEQVELSRR